MKENKYDDPAFFEKYSQMDRSRSGLAGAGEWHALQPMLPDFTGKRVLDLGCGYGWHCEYAAEHGAKMVVGVDISQKMLREASIHHGGENIEYRCAAIEDAVFADGSFDAVISSLAFHYIRSFAQIAENVSRWLVPGGEFVFSCEHPVFTAYGSQDWYYGPNGEILHFPVDRYFIEGERQATFLGEQVTKYHKTLTTYINTLLTHGFALTGLVEPQPPEQWVAEIEGMENELRRPMMLIVAAKKR